LNCEAACRTRRAADADKLPFYIVSYSGLPPPPPTHTHSDLTLGGSLHWGASLIFSRVLGWEDVLGVTVVRAPIFLSRQLFAPFKLTY
jgi:hypothetical protein